MRENVPLSRFGVLVAQLESIVASASQQSPDPLLCFDLLSDLISAIDEEPKESILLWQRKCEDALYSLITLGARRPIRHLASLAMARIISKGDSISIYSRVSSLQGFLSDGKRSDPQRVAGAAQCLGELYRHFGRRITSGLLETTNIASKLMKFNEEFVRQQALLMLQNALEGSGGMAAAPAYAEAFRLITRFAIGDKSFMVRIAAARCLKAFADIGGPGLGVGELDNLASYCVKALEDSVSSVRDAFAEALGSLLALGMNPEAQLKPRGKGPFPPAKKLEGGLEKHVALPFTRAIGFRSKDIRNGLALSWVFFLQAIRLKYLHPDGELQNYALNIIGMLHGDTSVDAHALACVLYILRVGVTDQMLEPTQRSFSVVLGKQLQSPDASPSMKIAALRTLSYTLKTLGEVPREFKEVFDDTVVAAVSHSSQLVRIEAALTLRTLAEVDPTCVGGLISYGVTTLNALRENVAFEKGNNLRAELDSLHGQATVLAALVSISPKLPLGYPARLPRMVLEVSKKMLTEPSRNLVAALVEQEAGWLLLSSLLSSMLKEELEDQVFDILGLWADVFTGNPEHVIKQCKDLISTICVWSAAVHALTEFVRRFVSSDVVNNGILLQPVIVYLNRALSYVSVIAAKQPPNIKSAVDIFIIRILIAYQSLPDPMAYKSDHPQIIQLCTTPYRDASGCEESSCLRLLLDKRDVWLGPWTPGRDWFEDELRAFQGGKDGLMPCVWENELSSFPLPETVNKTLVNQMLLCFGVMFASQDNGEMLSLLGVIEHCLKAGKKQLWHPASMTNICVGLLAGLKALLALRRQPLGIELLNSAQAIFQGILAEGDICASQRRASSEGLGLLARLGSDIFTARMSRLLLADLNGITDSSYAGSITFALGCIHRSAGGMALSSLVPATVNSISLLAKTSIAGLQIWSLHGLLLTVESAGLSFVSHVQATLGLAMDILLSEESGWVDLQQGVGRLINAIVAVIGPELAPGSIFFLRCKSVVAEISSWQETAALLESARFTQQLVLFAPQAVSVHSHVQTLLSTLSSRQPTLRHLAVSTLYHLIEKDPVSIIDEQIEDNLFHMLDEETDSEIGNLVRTTIRRLLYASCPSYPSRWRLICRNMILATSSRRTEGDNITENDSLNGTEGDTRFHYGEDDDNMVSSSRGTKIHVYRDKNKHLRYRTKVFAAECLSLLPEAVGTNPAHFDLSLAREKPVDKQNSGDWLVLRLQELISLAYEISTIQFANMRPIGVGLLSTIIDKFETIPDPELPGHLLLEQYQAQLLSAVRTALDTSSGPVLLEAGLQLATKIMTSGMISGDQNAVKRIFSLISRPLTDFKDLYYPSFAEWVSCKIKIRLLAAHASLKCYTYAFLRRHHVEVPDEYQALLPLFSESSSKLGEYWVRLLKDYSYICLCLTLKRNWTPLLDGIQSPMVSAKLQPCLEEAWPVILQALALDAVPARVGEDGLSTSGLISGYSMVKLDSREYQFLWGFAMLVLFQDNHPARSKQIIPLGETKAKSGADSEESGPPSLKLYEIVLPVFQFFCAQSFFSVGFLTISICQELLQVLSYSVYMENSWDSLAISILAQIVRNCPEDFLETEEFTYLAMELCFGFLFKIFQSSEASFTDDTNWEDLISPLLLTAKSLMKNFKLKMQFKSVPLALLLIGYKGIRQASTESCLSKVIDFAKGANDIVRKLFYDTPEIASDAKLYLRTIFGTWLDVIVDLTENCIEDLHLFETKRDNSSKVSLLKLAFCIEQNVSLAKLAHELECQGYDKEYSPLHFSVFKYCSKCIQAVLTHSNIQVQATGLQVLKSMVQRGTNFEDNFLIFFVGELLGDVFTIIKRILKKPITRASATTACECLGVLMLLQTQSKAIEAQKGFMNLFLEAILMVFSISEDGSSKEVNDIKSTVVRLVSHLVQIPSSAVQFKDVLLSMPVPQRQLLQGFIRSSVTQDKDAIQMKPMNPPLDIKLPAPTEVRVERNSVTSSTPRERDVPPSTISNDFNTASTQESEEDEDDWDTFQSFPASTSTSNLQVESVAEEPGLVENTSNSELSALSEDSQEQPHFQPLSVVQTSSAEHLEACEGLIVSNSDQVEQNDFRTEIAEPSEVQNQDSEEKTISGLEQKEEAASIHLEDAEGSPKELGTEDPEPKRDSPDYNHGVSSSDAEGLIEISKVEDEYGIQSPNDKLDLQELPDSLPADRLSCNEIPERKTDGQSKEGQVRNQEADENPGRKTCSLKEEQ